MATKRVTINKSNGTNDTFTFNIPEAVGTYNIKFTKSDGGVLNAGNIVVDGTQHTYRLTFGLSNGGSLDAGTFTTPIVQAWYTTFSGSQSIYGNNTGSFPSVKAGVRTRITYSGYVESDGFYNEAGDWVTERYNFSGSASETANGVFSGSRDFSTVGAFGSLSYSLTMNNGSVTFNASVSGSAYDPCGDIQNVTYANAYVTITKIEQYY